MKKRLEWLCGFLISAFLAFFHISMYLNLGRWDKSGGQIRTIFFCCVAILCLFKVFFPGKNKDDIDKES